MVKKGDVQQTDARFVSQRAATHFIGPAQSALIGSLEITCQRRAVLLRENGAAIRRV